MYEHKRKPLAPRAIYYRRIFNNVLLALLIMAISLVIGIVGYHFAADFTWLDSLYNASMILSGMGPVTEIKTVSGKLFSSAYAIFSGVVFITNIGVILAPAIHRLIHRLHLEDQ